MALDDWPSGPGAERSQKLLAAVATGQFEHSWCPLTLSDGENTLEVQVSCDALKIDGVRVGVTARDMQKIADMLIGLFLTAKLVDRIYQQTDPSNRLDPKTMPISASTASYIEHSAKVDAEIAKRGASGLLANVGKDWILTRKIFTPQALAGRKASNYGFIVPTDPWKGINTDPTASLPGVYAIQGGPYGGTTHDSAHEDYSQKIRIISRNAILNGSPVDMADVYTGVHGDAVARLVSSEGALPGTRQGGDASSPTVPPMALVPPASKTQQPPPKTPPVGGTTSAAMGGTTTNKTKGAILGAAVGGILGALLKSTASTWAGAAIGGGLGYFFAPKKSEVLKSIPVSVTDLFEASAASSWPEVASYVERWAWREGWKIDCSGNGRACLAVPSPSAFYAWHDWVLHAEPGTGLKQWVDHGWLYSWPA